MLDLIHAYENYLAKVKQASANTISSYMRDIRQFSTWLHETEGLDVVDAKQLNIVNFFSYLKNDGRTGATVSRNTERKTTFHIISSIAKVGQIAGAKNSQK